MKIIINTTARHSSSGKYEKQCLFHHLKCLSVILKLGTCKILIRSGNKYLYLINQSKFTVFLKLNSIILPLFDPVDVNNFLKRNVTFYQLKQYHIPEGFILELETFTSALFHTAYSYTLQQIRAWSCTYYWFIYLFGRMLLRNYEEIKLLLILNNNWQESLQETEVAVTPHVTTRCY